MAGLLYRGSLKSALRIVRPQGLLMTLVTIGASD